MVRLSVVWGCFFLFLLVGIGCRDSADSVLETAGQKVDDRVHSKPRVELVQQADLELKEDDVVLSLALAPDGKTLAVGVRYEPVQIWDWRTGKTQVALPGTQDDVVLSMVFSPDGNQLVAVTQNAVAWRIDGVSYGKSVKVWDLVANQLIETVPLRALWRIKAAALTDEGKLLGAGCPEEDGFQVLRIWNLRTEQMQAAVKERAFCHALCFNSTGELLGSCDFERVRLIDSLTGEVYAALECGFSSPVIFSGTPTANSSGGYLIGGSVQELAFTADGSLIASIDAISSTKTPSGMWDRPASEREIAMREGRTGAVLASVETYQLLRFSPSCLALSADGRVLAAAANWPARIILWDVRRLPVP